MSGPKSYEKLTTLTSATLLSKEVYNPMNTYPESLTNGAIGAGGSWSVTGDFAIAANAATYTHATNVGTLVQATTDMTRTGRSGAIYEFTYTFSGLANTYPTLSITTTFAKTATPLVGSGVAGTYSVRFEAATTPGNFVIGGVSGAAGAITLDDLSLKEIVSGRDQMQAKRAVLTCEVGAINFTFDGTTPTVTSGTYQGHILNVGDVLTLNDIVEIQQFRCINAVASNGAVLKVSYSF